MLEIKNLHANVAGKPILKGLNLSIGAGEVHAIMGPNGAGKSTLGNVIAGRDGYEVTAGEVLYNGKDILGLEPDERACEGIFLAFQYPVEIPGVNNTYFLKAALNAARKHQGLEELDAMDFLAMVREKRKIIHLDEELLHRPVNAGFSGGEKKRNEILQLGLLDPALSILDETDSGLDIDALRKVATDLRRRKAQVTGLLNVAGTATMNMAVTTPEEVTRLEVRTDRADLAGLSGELVIGASTMPCRVTWWMPFSSA